MTLFGVSSQANELAIEKQKVERCRMGTRFTLAYKQKPYTSAAVFHQYPTIVLIQFIDSLRENDEFALKPVALLMDEFSLHRR
jgi:hypothetical protein